MEERMISETDVRFVVERGIRSPLPADPVAAPRFSCSAMVRGRWLKVVVAAEEDELVVITVFLLRI
jgi:hypothetical protein